MKLIDHAVVGVLCVLAGLATSPVRADDYSPPKIYSVTPTGVNLSDGSYTFTVTDLAIGPMKLDRFYISGLRDPNTKFFGPRVTSNFDIYVARNVRAPISPGVLPRRYAPIVHIGDSSMGVYAQPADAVGEPVGLGNPDAFSGVLTAVGASYTYTAHDGTLYTFGGPAAAGNPDGQRVTSIAFPDGRTQTFSYNGSGQLKLVSDSSGYAIVFDYNASGFISAACGFNLSQDYVTATSTCSGAALKTSYGYTSGLLTSVTDVTGQTTSYGRTANSEINCITPPGYSSCKVSTTFVSGTPFDVSQQTLADGSVWNYGLAGAVAGARSDGPSSTLDPTNGGYVTDPNGKTSYYEFSKTSPFSIRDANGKTTSYVYTGGREYEWDLYDIPPDPHQEGSMLIEADFPEGNKYLAEYNGPYNSVSKETFVPKPGSGLANAVVQYGYTCTTLNGACNKPTSKIDPKGNQTDYTYASWGGTLSEMQPAPTSGAARPLKLYTYVQKYAYVKNSGGTLVSTGVPIWVISTITQCQTVAGSSAAACDTTATAPRLQTTYQYGADGTANNLLARGTEVKDLVTGAARLTCVTYDPIGRKISETSPRGTTSISVCP